MTTQEFSNTFDTLLNSYASQAMFGDQASRNEIVLDEYEKSVLLTQAQDIIVKQYFQRTSAGEGFDDSARRQTDFSNLITVADCTAAKSSTGFVPYDDRALVFQLPCNTKKQSTAGQEGSENTTEEPEEPTDTPTETPTEETPTTTKVLFILNEKLIKSKENKIISQCVVVPINYHEYDRQMSKAFSQPLKKQAWRLTQDNENNNLLYAEVVPNDAFRGDKEKNDYTFSYRIRYIRRPKPIILVDLSQDSYNDLDIDGYSEVSECELNPILHMDILNKAVELALSTRGVTRQNAQ